MDGQALYELFRTVPRRKIITYGMIPSEQVRQTMFIDAQGRFCLE